MLAKEAMLPMKIEVPDGVVIPIMKQFCQEKRNNYKNCKKRRKSSLKEGKEKGKEGIGIGKFLLFLNMLFGKRLVFLFKYSTII